MKDFTERDQRVTRELDRFRLFTPSPDLRDRVLLAAREAMVSGDAELSPADRWMRAFGALRQEILAFASAVMLILGVAMQFAGNQGVLADSIERWQVMASVSGSLHRATSMDCTVTHPGAGDESPRYRVRWNAGGITRVDMSATSGAQQTQWISKEAVSAADGKGGALRSMTPGAMPAQWQPLMEFLTPEILAQRMERYGLVQAENPQRAHSDELVLVGQSVEQAVEIAVDAETFLPKTIRKFPAASDRSGRERGYLEEARFQWNKPVARELFIPGATTARRKAQ